MNSILSRRATRGAQPAAPPLALAVRPDERLEPDGRSVFVTAPDGLRLHARRYGSKGTNLPVVCLPGLARTAADFHALATALAADAERPRLVVAIDYRGHGRSDYDRNPDNYSQAIDLADISAVLTALAVGPAIFVGTSHGGLRAMTLAVGRPTIVAGLVLNDIGPVIEPRALMRLKRTVGQLPVPRNFAEGGDILRRLFGAQFSGLSPADWLAFARRTWREHKGGLVPDYDVKLARTLQRANLERPPTLWHQFDGLGRIPLMVVRGANSDMLAAATLDAMLARRSQLDVTVVPDQGHAPLLAEPKHIQRIAAFMADCDAAPATS